MILTANPFHQPFRYAPSKPSPLSPRSSNVPSPTFNFTMASEKKPVPQRAHKPNPVMQTRDQATQRRRDMFFRRVQKERDDKKWEARGEQVQRLDFISDHKRWEAEKARQAPELQDDLIEEDEDELPSSCTYATDSTPRQYPQQEMSEADYILLQEQEDLDFLIATMEEENRQETASQHFGSDDEDYDQLFMAVTPEVTMQQRQDFQSNTLLEDHDMMDTTDG